VTRSIPRPDRPTPRVLPAVAATALLGIVVVAGLAGRITGGDATPAATTTTAAPVAVPPAPTSTAPAAATTTAPPAPTAPPRSALTHTLGTGSYGAEVQMVQQRLKDLGFEPGPIDGQFGALTRAAVWAFEKLILETPSDQPTGRVTDAMWQRMQEPIEIRPRRPNAKTANHTEVYLPEQVVAFFVGDRPVLISHMSSGTGEQWCDEVTISPGEIGNEEGTEPLQRGECGISNTPGGVYRYYRRVTGVRESGLGGMWNPVYFNYGIAIHGALNVPLHPASHGCIRIPLPISETFQQYIGDRDQVFVFDGRKDPEAYGAQVPRFNWLDPAYTTTTTSTTTTPTPPTTSAPPPGQPGPPSSAAGSAG
jgi:Putative peptidoglycan binding domain/L,D-transpeptidase catalytic domain